MTTQQSNTKLTMPIKDTIILDSKKFNAELLTIHADGRITVAEHLSPTETAAKVLQIMREQWMADIQSKKIREQEDRIKRLEDAGDVVEERVGYGCGCGGPCRACRSASENWFKAKEAKL
jgi:hypothetical protein